jgi:hypothetical protein
LLSVLGNIFDGAADPYCIDSMEQAQRQATLDVRLTFQDTLTTSITIDFQNAVCKKIRRIASRPGHNTPMHQQEMPLVVPQVFRAPRFQGFMRQVKIVSPSPMCDRLLHAIKGQACNLPLPTVKSANPLQRDA